MSGATEESGVKVLLVSSDTMTQTIHTEATVLRKRTAEALWETTRAKFPPDKRLHLRASGIDGEIPWIVYVDDLGEDDSEELFVIFAYAL